MDTAFLRLPGEGTMVEVPYQPPHRPAAAPADGSRSPSPSNASSAAAAATAGGGAVSAADESQASLAVDPVPPSPPANGGGGGGASTATTPTPTARAGIVLLAPTDGHPVPVSLIITNYRVHAQPAPRLPVAVQPINIPVLAIDSYSRGSVHVPDRTSPGGTRKQWTLTVQTKLIFSFTFGFRDEASFQRIVKCLDFVVQEATAHLRQLPAFSIAAAFRKEAGLPSTDAEIEAARAAGPAAAAAATAAASAAPEGGGADDSSSSETDEDAVKPRPSKSSELDTVSAAAAVGGTSAKSDEQDELPVEGADDESPAAAGRRSQTAVGVAAEYAEWATDAGWALYDVEEEWARQLALDPTVPAPTADIDAASTAGTVGIGRDLRPWYRVTYLDQPTNSYGTFATYPVGIVAPNAVSDDLLKRAAVFRSRARIPAISYVCLSTGGVIARCSQPMLRQSDSARRDDSTLCASLINAYTAVTTKPRDVSIAGSSPATKHSSSGGHGGGTNSSFVAPPSLVDDGDWDLPTSKDTAPTPAAAFVPRCLNVIDLRPKGAATGNMAMGGGYESGSGYGMCKLQFGGIENIHAVTAAWQKIRAIVVLHNGRGVSKSSGSGESFLDQLHASQWLYHIQKVLIAADEITQLVAVRSEPVLTHCTDGWDRTAQATSLSMILMDPYFRTVRGLCVLVEKEFCSFGHKFAERNMHELKGDTCGTAHISGGLSDVDRQQDQHKAHKQQPSPIFAQWLDCVFQIVRQFPTKFEFTPKLLELLAWHVHSCFFGTFICNGARERILEGVTTQTISLWSEIERLVRVEREEGKAGTPPPASRRLLNPLYRPPTAPAATISASASNADLAGSFSAVPSAHAAAHAGPGVMLDRLPLCVDSSRLAFWESHYLKYDADRWHGSPSFEEAALAAIPARAGDPHRYMWRRAAARRPAHRAAHVAAVALRDPAIKRREHATSAASLASVPVDPKAKQCWRCHEKFVAFLRPSAPCGHCRHLHCPKCLQTVPGSATKEKRCESCISAFASNMPADE